MIFIHLCFYLRIIFILVEKENEMEVIEKGNAPDGTRIQIEDWSMNYSSYPRKSTIGFYPKAKHSLYNDDNSHFPPYPERGKIFRACFSFDSEEEAKKAFDDIVSGRKSYMEYLDNYSNAALSKDYFIKSMTV